MDFHGVFIEIITNKAEIEQHPGLGASKYVSGRVPRALWKN